METAEDKLKREEIMRAALTAIRLRDEAIVTKCHAYFNWQPNFFERLFIKWKYRKYFRSLRNK